MKERANKKERNKKTCDEFRFNSLKPFVCSRFLFFLAVGAVDLNSIDWSANAIKGIERSEKGSEVIFFLKKKI